MLLITTVARWVTGGGDQTNIVILILLIILVCDSSPGYLLTL